MNLVSQFVGNEERFISPDHNSLQYTGRIDFDNKLAPVLVYPCSSIGLKFKGTTLKLIVQNHHSCWDNYLGFILDGKQEKILLKNDGIECLTLAKGLQDKEHNLLLFKRMDSCHMITFHGFILNDDARVLKLPKLPERKIEVYGDSVSAGEVSEAVSYTGCVDPVHNGEYSNSWYSYVWMAARKLNARIHNIAQGGIALREKTGWFGAPNYIGMEQTFDKIEYHPDLGKIKKWDFSNYRPHVVIIAIGQNDSHPMDYMKEDYDSTLSKEWREHYKQFVLEIRKKYEQALIILATTILYHDSNWDKSIASACKDINDEKIVHFMYTRNGSGTPGHIRISEADEMSDELVRYINTFGEEIWEDY